MIHLKKLPAFKPFLIQILIATILIGLISVIAIRKADPEINNPKINLSSNSSSFTLKPTIQDSLGVATTSDFYLITTELITRKQIKNNLSFDNNTEYQLSRDKDKWKIKLLGEIKPNSMVNATLSTFDKSGKLRLWQWAYQYKTAFQVTSTYPENQTANVSLNDKVIIRFTHDNFIINDKNIIIEPTVTGKFSHVGRNLIFTPKNSLKSGTLYKVTVKKDLDISNTRDKLASDFIFRFETSSYNQADKQHRTEELIRQFYENEQPIFDLAYSTSSIISLYAYDSADSFIRDKAKSDALWWQKAKTIYMPDIDSGKKIFTYKSSSSPKVTFPVNLVSGFYLAKIQNPTGDHFIWFQISDLVAYNNTDKNQAFVWINKNRKPIKDAKVEIYGSDESSISNQDGVAILSLPETIKKTTEDPKRRSQVYLKISVKDQTLVLPLYDFNSPHFSQLENIDSENKFTWALSKDVYKPGEPLTINANTGIFKEYPSSTFYIAPANEGYKSYTDEEKYIFSSTSGTFPEMPLVPNDYVILLKSGEQLIDRRYFSVSDCSQISTVSNPNTAQYYPASQTDYNLKLISANPLNLLLNINGNPLATSAENNYLYLSYNQGYKDYQVSLNPLFNLKSTSSISSVFGIYLDSTGYRITEQSYLSTASSSTNPVSSGSWSQTASRIIPNRDATPADMSDFEISNPTPQMCAKYLSVNLKRLRSDITTIVYQLPDGGLTLDKNNFSGNLELSALIATTENIKDFDQAALYSYFINKLESPTATKQEMTYAMAGLAGVNENILTRINNWLNYRKDLSNREKLFLSLGLDKLKAVELSKQIKANIDPKKLSLTEQYLFNINNR